MAMRQKCLDDNLRLFSVAVANAANFSRLGKHKKHKFPRALSEFFKLRKVETRHSESTVNVVSVDRKN